MSSKAKIKSTSRKPADLNQRTPLLNSSAPAGVNANQSGSDLDTDPNKGPQAERTRSKKVADIHEKIESVKNVMAENIQKVMKRGDDLEKLQDISSNLEDRSKHFEKATGHVKTKYQNQNRKYMIILICCSCVTLLVVIIWLVVTFS